VLIAINQTATVKFNDSEMQKTTIQFINSPMFDIEINKIDNIFSYS